MIVKLHICVSTMNHKVAHSHTHTAAAQPLQTHNRNLLLSIYLRMFTVSCHIYLFLVYNRVGFGDNKKVVIISLFSLALFRSCLYFVCSFDVFIFRVDLCISLRRELGVGSVKCGMNKKNTKKNKLKNLFFVDRMPLCLVIHLLCCVRAPENSHIHIFAGFMCESCFTLVRCTYVVFIYYYCQYFVLLPLFLLFLFVHKAHIHFGSNSFLVKVFTQPPNVVCSLFRTTEKKVNCVLVGIQEKSRK